MNRQTIAQFGINLLLFSLPLAAQTSSSNPWRFASIDVPGATGTWVRGVNNHGEVVGFSSFANSACPVPGSSVEVPNCNVRGFKIVNGTLVKLNVPNALSTAIMGVNDLGDLVGFYLKPEADCPAGVYHGFLWLHTNVIKTLDYPGTAFCGNASAWTVPMGINKAGIIAGTVWNSPDSRPAGGFVWRNGIFSVMDLGEPDCYACSGVYGISNNGILVGTAWYTLERIPTWTGWLKTGADEDFFLPFTDDTFTTAVNNATDIAGWVIPGAGFFAKHIELNEGTNDAVEVKPSPIHLMIGDATWPFAMNDSRAVVGTYRDSAGVIHGFMASPTF